MDAMPIRFPSAMLPPAPGPARRAARGGGEGQLLSGEEREGEGGKGHPQRRGGGVCWEEEEEENGVATRPLGHATAPPRRP